MTGVAVDARPTETLDSRARDIVRDLRSIIELSEWVAGERNTPPDLRHLNRKLTSEALLTQKSDLEQWREMFSESLDNYRGLVNMTPAEWAALTEADIVGLEGMIRQAANGIALWV